MVPLPSITTTWTSSNLPPLSEAYSDVVGGSAIVFHLTVDTVVSPPTVDDEMLSSWASNQSACEVYVVEAYDVACPLVWIATLPILENL